MYGKNYLLNKIVRVETIDKNQEVKALKKEIKALKEAYAEMTIEKKFMKLIFKYMEKKLAEVKK